MHFRRQSASLDPEKCAIVRATEDIWNVRDVDATVLRHRIDCQWRDQGDFLWGREQIRAFLTRKWQREVDFRIIMELWASSERHFAVRFCSEYRRDGKSWFRAYGNEAWGYDENGLVSRRLSSANECPIEAHQRALLWGEGTRPHDHATLEELGL
jgi:nuclear transport factor 2 (NTF2) superfamily protein